MTIWGQRARVDTIKPRSGHYRFMHARACGTAEPTSRPEQLCRGIAEGDVAGSAGAACVIFPGGELNGASG